jgi:hypothetical protein
MRVVRKTRAKWDDNLVSSLNASTLFELRAYLREKLVAWLASFEGGRYLVRARLEDALAIRRG